jgi:hypothetical protein
MKSVFFVCVFATLFSAGCRKRASTNAANAPVPAETAPGGATPTQTPKGAFVPALPVPADAPAAKAQTELDRKLASGNPQVQVQVLDEILQAWAMSNPELPKDLEEFVRAGMLTKIPSPPPGKRFLIDRKTARVVLANQ